MEKRIIEYNRIKTQNKMLPLNSHTSVFILNMNRLNSQLKNKDYQTEDQNT